LRLRIELGDGARGRFGIDVRGVAAASGSLRWRCAPARAEAAS
jgi:hypothetical protein